MIEIPPAKPAIKGVPVYVPKPTENPNLEENQALLAMFTNSIKKDKELYIDSYIPNTPKPKEIPPIQSGNQQIGKSGYGGVENPVTYYVIYYRYLDSKTWNHSGLSKDKEILRKSVESKPYVDINSIYLTEVNLPL